MKAIQVLKPGSIAIVEKDIPLISNENEVIVKVKYAGICGSDMHIYHGTSPVATYPRVIGHEFVGEIVEKGSKVKTVEIGDHVVVEPIVYCGECYACKNGRPNICRELEVIGVHRDGGFQEYVVLNEKNVHKFDTGLKWRDAVLIEPFTIAAQVTWRGDVKKDDFVYIVGAGPIGLAILQYAKYKGAKCIISDLYDSKLEVAKSLGADYIINSKTDNSIEKVMEITDGMGSNVTIDAVGIPQIFEQAVEVTSIAGRIVIMGFVEQPSRIAQLEITKKELTIVGSRLQTNKFGEVVELFNKGKFNTDIFVTKVFKFEEIREAIKMIENNPESTRKILLEF